MKLEGDTKTMFSVRELAALFAVEPATINSRIRHGDIPAEPKLGRRQSGYLIPGVELAARLREQGLEGQARMVEEAMARG